MGEAPQSDSVLRKPKVTKAKRKELCQEAGNQLVPRDGEGGEPGKCGEELLRGKIEPESNLFCHGVV